MQGNHDTYVRTHGRSLEAFGRRRKTAAIDGGVRGQVSAWLSYDLISPRGQSVIKISANQRTRGTPPISSPLSPDGMH